MATVAIIGTCDTKLQELLFLRERIHDNQDVKTILIDVGRTPTNHEAITITQEQLAQAHRKAKDILEYPRGELIEFMSKCASSAVKDLYDQGKIDGIVSAGGSSGTSLSAAVMRDVLPVGFPKLIVSTMASGDTRPIVGETDITLMHSVVDVAGLNHILRGILSNAGASIAAAALSYAKRKKQVAKENHVTSTSSKKWSVGITMFGVTTPGVDAIRTHLESNYPIETYVFHAVGTGGRSLERLIREGQIDGLIDLTTTEICDHIVGGVLSAGEGRLDAAVEAGIPNIVSLGALDMVNFGPKSTVPEKFQGRKLFEHNPMVTLMRTSPEECQQIGQFICRKLRKTTTPNNVQLWIPKGGVSVIDVPGAPFADEEADSVLFDTIRCGLEGSGIEVVEDDRDVNDQAFAKDIAEALAKKLGLKRA